MLLALQYTMALSQGVPGPAAIANSSRHLRGNIGRQILYHYATWNSIAKNSK